MTVKYKSGHEKPAGTYDSDRKMGTSIGRGNHPIESVPEKTGRGHEVHGDNRVNNPDRIFFGKHK